ncbi:26849_t:CDS:2 [Dentiscutata erythropus]|uniref:26849_t:CDS:1 n=1 Tax=Dentiscutata erythropus TaxID=1348616 RepID=A0A9N9HT43_9GLOM|nr:26849_t:CDS:2 [Dentiscutata erythropus]
MAKLCDKQISILKKYINFVTPSITRWNSHFKYFDSVFKNKYPLKTLVTKDDVALDDDLKLLTEIKIAINYDSFWDSLTILYKLLCPFCRALDLMQYDKARLHNVLHTFDYSFSALSSSAALVSASFSLSNQDLEFEETNTDDINEEITSEIN